MTPFAVAGIQMYLSATESNIKAMQVRLDTLMALYPWVQMVVFSELAPYGPLLSKAEPLPGPGEEAFCEMANQHHIWLVPGSIFERADGHLYNTASVIDPDGRVVGRHRKLFPFRPYEEGVASGDQFLVFEVPSVGKFGISICYDMWFPETSRTLAVMGAEVILHPSLTGTLDRRAELSIAHATAVTNQCYVFDINGLGAGGNGQSIICGPDGEILHQAASGEEMMPLEIDLERVRRSRSEGLLRLGQPLKSFRDRKVQFPIYQPDAQTTYLESLGPLKKTSRQQMTGGQAAKSASTQSSKTNEVSEGNNDESPERRQ